MNIETLELMQVEWDAWQRVVHEWPGDMNDSRWNPLVEAIRHWGETLVALRVEQTPEERAAALAANP